MVRIGDNLITVNDFYSVLYCDSKIDFAESAIKRINDSHQFLKGYNKDHIIYGINTGLGPMAQYKISREDALDLQYNAIRGHASGCGEAIDVLYVKSALFVLLNNLSQGFSGIHPSVVILIRDLINKNIIPFVPEHGGVGASGDLTQLAHVALVLIGEGEVFYKGMRTETSKVFEAEGLKGIAVHIREGLSLINGTCFMSGIGMINLIQAKNLLDWSILSSAMLNEIVHSFNDYFSEELNSVKQHKGQQYIASKIRELLQNSKRIRIREDESSKSTVTKGFIEDKVQEYYSIRCTPQVLGPIYDTINNVELVLTNEVNSCCDNPVVDAKNNHIYHGGNFHGDYVSLEMDKLKIVITKLSMLCERQINYLMNPKLNGILPPFINLGTLGVNFGMQGLQFPATSTVAENQTISFPMYLHSIPNNNDNQDIVSMGSNSALLTKKVIENTYQVITIELLSIIQAIDYLNIHNEMSSLTLQFYKDLRKISPVFKNDTPKYNQLKTLKNYLSGSNFYSQFHKKEVVN